MHHTTRRQLTLLFSFILLLVIGTYIYFQAEDLINGPMVEIRTPENGVQVNDSLITIEGVAENISYIKMNGRQIFVNEAGLFSEKLLLSYGYNIITVVAEDKFKRVTREVLEIVYK